MNRTDWERHLRDHRQIKKGTVRGITQAIREILDRHGSHLTVLWNFTFSEPEDLPAIENVLGQAIMERVNQHIVFREASSEDMVSRQPLKSKLARMAEPGHG